MNNYHNKLIRNISLLYELSLSVGSSVHLIENCENFTKALIKNKNLDFASVWILENQIMEVESEQMTLLHINNGIASSRISDPTHFIRQELQNKPFFSLHFGNQNFEKLIQEENVNTGSYAIFKLGDIGFLKLYSSKLDKPFPNLDLASMSKVIEKFTVSLKACLAHERLLNETEQRLQMQRALAKSHSKLISAKQTAEQARMAEQQFLANMSHEIRTPMNAVIGMTHLLDECNTDIIQKEYIDALKFSADNLMGIINNILDLSKIEAGELMLEKVSFNLTTLLQNLQQTFQLKMKDKPVEVHLSIDKQITNKLLGDPTRLTQILTNLLSNAGKFTHEGRIDIIVNVLQGVHNQLFIRFQIKDTGIGIEQEKINLIFENFKQADIHTARKYGGTGLGLAIVKQLIELQDGNIQVESEKGKGANFYFTLAYENTAIKATDELKAVKENIQHADAILQSHQLLIVEDNLMNQKLISKVLDLWQCSYDIVDNGLEAINILKNRDFDLILMDMYMPEMDGIVTTVTIRNMKTHPNHNRPIIALTAAALLDEKNRALEQGMNDFITKPFSPKQLRNTLLKWLPKSPKTTNTKVMIDSKPKVELGYLLELSKNDPLFVMEIIQIFLDEIPIAMQQLRQALEDKNWDELSVLAHRMKSNFIMVGMTEQQKIALELELMCKENRIIPIQISNYVKQLEQDTQQVYPIMQDKLEIVKIIG